MTLQNKPEIPKAAVYAIVAAIGIPLLIAAIFTLNQWYPATYIIGWLSDNQGQFSLKLAIALNWLAIMIPELVLIAVAGFIKNTILKKK